MTSENIGMRIRQEGRAAKWSSIVKTRSCLVLLVWISVITVQVTAQDTGQPPPVEVSLITGHLHQLRCNDNVGVIASIGDDGTLLVDTGYAGTATAVSDELAKLGSGPVRIIVNTHGDGDHVGGNPALGDAAVIVAHPGVRRQMGRYFALPVVDAAGLPSVTVTEDATIHFNNDVIRLLPMPGGHTAADMVVHFTQSRIACIGDLVLLGTFPNADPGRGGDAQRLIEVLNELHKNLPADTTLVAAHGGVFTMAELEAYIEMIEGTVAAVAAEVAAGRSFSEIVERNPLAQWGAWESPEVGLSFESWIAEIHASLTGSFTQSICAPVTEALVEDGVGAAVTRYRQLKEEEPEDWRFAENELNMLGYQLLARDRVDDAIVILELNVEAFPDGFNTYDSLAESYMIAGRTEEAIANYERSLELNPDNTNAVTMLARLREE
jgi:glyoxylase-like metal-dependent hydrolase (beta-lactamase superfamily II)